MQSISLADELTLEHAPAEVEQDEVVCPGVPGRRQENLAARALAAFRAATGWEAPPLRLSIVKRIPVAAGLGGGSADAAGALRLAGTFRGSATRRCCASWARRWAPMSPRRSPPGAGWPAAPVSCWRRCRTPTRRRSACSSCPRRPGSRLRRCTREADRLGLGRSSETLEERRRALRRALELSAARARGERAAGQRPAAGGDLAVSGYRRRALPGTRGGSGDRPS